MNRHLQVDELLGAYALSATTADESSMVREHVAVCDECADNLGRLAETAAALSLAVEDIPAPPGLRERILTAARADASAVNTDELVPRSESKARLLELAFATRPATWSRRTRLAFVIPATAAAALLVSLGGWNVNLQHQLDSQQRAVAQRNVIQGEIRDAADSRLGTVTYMPQQHVAFVALHALATPNDGRAYELWLIRPGMKAIPVAVFRPDADGNKVLVVPQDVTAASLAITIEPIGGSLQPTTPPVAQGHL